MVLRVQTMRASVPATASTSAASRWPRRTDGRGNSAPPARRRGWRAPGPATVAMRRRLPPSLPSGRIVVESQMRDRAAGRRAPPRPVRRCGPACAPPAGASAVWSRGDGEFGGDVAGAAQILFQRARAPSGSISRRGGGRVKSRAVRLMARAWRCGVSRSALGLGQGQEAARAGLLVGLRDNRCANGRRGFPAAPARPRPPASPSPVMLSRAGSPRRHCSSRPIMASASRRPSASRSRPTDRFIASRRTCGGGRRGESRWRRQLAAGKAGEMRCLGRPRRRGRRTPGLPAASWRPAGWRRAGRWRRIRPPPTGRRGRNGRAHPRRCRPYGNAPPAPPGWARDTGSMPAAMQAA